MRNEGPNMEMDDNKAAKLQILLKLAEYAKKAMLEMPDDKAPKMGMLEIEAKKVNDKPAEIEVEMHDGKDMMMGKGPEMDMPEMDEDEDSKEEMQLPPELLEMLLSKK